MGGGGQNSLNSPENGDFPQSEDDGETPVESEYIGEYIYKTYAEFLALHLPDGVYLLDGSGTEENPYQINSLSDFLSYHEDASGTYKNKYVELNCDIELNDERFDEDGKPTGGIDGIVYSWGSGKSDSGVYFNGNGHTIFGMYYNDVSSVSVYLLSDTFQEVSYLTVSNFYISTSGTAAGICSRAEVVEFCNTKNGNIIGDGTAVGIVVTVGTIKGCMNECNCLTTARQASGVALSATFIENCVNRGNIKGSYSADGIGSAREIKNCINYGSIKSQYASGMGNATYIYSCSNYGVVDAGRAGGMVASPGNITIDNCKNFGKILGSYRGAIVGDFLGNYKTIVIKNCYVEVCEGSVTGIYGRAITSRIDILNCYTKHLGSAGGSFLGATFGEHGKVKVRVKNCIYETLSHSATGLLCANSSNGNVYGMNGVDVEVSNIHIIVHNAPAKSTSLNLITYVSTTDFYAKNIFVELKFDLPKNLVTLKSSNAVKDNIDNVIVSMPSGGYYLGNSFSAFSMGWKTGEISLRSISGTSSFSSMVDVELLENKSYQSLN